MKCTRGASLKEGLYSSLFVHSILLLSTALKQKRHGNHPRDLILQSTVKVFYYPYKREEVREQVLMLLSLHTRGPHLNQEGLASTFVYAPLSKQHVISICGLTLNGHVYDMYS